jgi:hypothetical protein
MAMTGLLLSSEERIDRLKIACERVGGKAALGRALGYKDGAFVGQMLRGERPITEKTISALLCIKKVADLFSLTTYASGLALPSVIDATPSSAAHPNKSSNVTELQAQRQAVDTLTELQALVDSLTPLLRDAGINVLHKWLDGQASATEAAAVLEQLQQISAGARPVAENRAA